MHSNARWSALRSRWPCRWARRRRRSPTTSSRSACCPTCRACTPTSPARVRSLAAKMAIEDSGIEKRGFKVELVSADHQNKPDVGFGDRAPVVRHRQGRRDRRRAELGRGARGEPDHQGQEQGVPGLGSGLVGPHRQGLLAEHRPLDLRHVDARQRHRRRDREDRRRLVVLPDGRLRVRPRARARYRSGRAEERRQGAGQGARAAQHAGLQLVPAAGAGVQGEDRRTRQRRRRHDQLDQAGRRVRHRQGRPEPRRTAGVPHRRARARAADGAGPDRHRTRSTGTERRRRARSPSASPRPTRASIRRWSTRACTRRCCITSRRSRR